MQPVRLPLLGPVHPEVLEGVNRTFLPLESSRHSVSMGMRTIDQRQQLVADTGLHTAMSVVYTLDTVVDSWNNSAAGNMSK